MCYSYITSDLLLIYPQTVSPPLVAPIFGVCVRSLVEIAPLFLVCARTVAVVVCLLVSIYFFSIYTMNYLNVIGFFLRNNLVLRKVYRNTLP